MSARGLWLAAGAASVPVLGGISTALILASDHEDNKTATIALAVTAGVSFIASGLIALWRRPENRTGYVLAAVGYFWFLGALGESNNDWVFTFGAAFGSLALGAFVHLLLAFPGGRLVRRRDLWLVVATYALVLVGGIGMLLFDETPNPDCPGCRSTIAIGTNEGVHDVLRVGTTLIGLALLATILVIVVDRFRRSQGALRRALGPVLGAGVLCMVFLALQLAIHAYSSAAAQPLEYVFLASFAMVPLAFLVGVLRSRLARSGVADLLLELTHERPLRDALASALRDPSLEVVYWLPDRERFVWHDGTPFHDDGGPRTAHYVERSGRRVGAILHDPSLADEPELVDAVAAAAGLWLDNERLQAELRAQVKFLEAIVNASPSLLCSLRRDGTIASLNDGAWNASGYAEENDVKGRFFWDVFVDPDARDEARRRFEAAAPAHEAASFEHTFVNRRGEQLTIAWSTGPLLDDDGSVRYVVCGGLDITERQRQHRQIQASEERLRATIQASPVAIIEVGLDDRVVMWNPAAEQMFGWSEEEMLGHPIRHVQPERRQELQELFDRVRGGEIYTGVETTRVRKDGTVIDVAIAAAPIHDPNGKVVGHLALFADISERKRQEEELRASRARIVEAGDAARWQLERNLHDGAQQRLVSLSLSLRLAQSKVSTDPAAAEVVLEGARAELAAALDELRELARGIHPAVLTDRGLAAAVEALAVRSPVPVEFETPDEALPRPVEAAAYYVVAEALANVTKYAGATAVKVRVAREDGKAVVEVSDDGVGGADASAGTGLRGLADRVEALGGSLTVDSPPGDGTCITAVIPLQPVRTQ